MFCVANALKVVYAKKNISAGVGKHSIPVLETILYFRYGGNPRTYFSFDYNAVNTAEP